MVSHMLLLFGTGGTVPCQHTLSAIRVGWLYYHASNREQSSTGSHDDKLTGCAASFAL